MTYTWVEPFAGAAACALRLVGGKALVPPCAWMGSKRRYARAILDAMGVPAERPARVLLADAGPWGWVWPLLLDGSSAGEVARVLRSWVGEHPRDLWQRLAAVAPLEDPHERAAQWLWLQARSASGVPIWWDGWRLAQEDGRDAVIGRLGDARAARLDAEKAQARLWLASDGRGVARPVGGRWEKGNVGREQDASNGQRGSWRFGARPGDAGPDRPAAMSGDKALAACGSLLASLAVVVAPVRRTGGMVNPGTIAERVEVIARAFSGVEVAVRHGDAGALTPPGGWGCWCNGWQEGRHVPTCAEVRAGAARGAFVYLDPPYRGATGYGWDMPREKVLELARRWADAGAVVAVSEAEPLALPDWHRLELTREGGKAEWLTLSRSPSTHAAQRRLFPVRGVS